MEVICLPEENGGVWRLAPEQFPKPDSYVLSLVGMVPCVLYYSPKDWVGWALVTPNKKKGTVNLKEIALFNEQILWADLPQVSGSQIRFREDAAV